MLTPDPDQTPPEPAGANDEAVARFAYDLEHRVVTVDDVLGRMSAGRDASPPVDGRRDPGSAPSRDGSRIDPRD